MRDLVIIAIVVVGAAMALRRPWIGMLLWTWLSLMNPHQAFGWATADMPLAQIAAIATLTVLLLTRERRNPLERPAVWALLGFVLWITITLPFSEYIDLSLPIYLRSIKIFLMIFVTIALIDDRRKLDAFILICVISLAYFGVKGGVFTILTAGEYRVWGPGGFIKGNNEIAAALIMIEPLLYYLLMQEKRRSIRLALIGTMVLSVVGIIGTQSRGALVAVSAMALFLWLKSSSKVLGGGAIVLTLSAVFSFMPEKWWDRMHTINDYATDNSALGRLNAWTFCWNVASDRFFGGGMVMYTREMFERYSPDPERVHAAHSIYFQVMGEHGFVGLAIFIAIGIFTWLDARKLIKLAGNNAAVAWAADLGRMVQVSLIGYATGGAFLSLAYFDLPYNIMVIAVCALYVVKRQVESQAVQAAQAAQAAGTRPTGIEGSAIPGRAG